MPHSPPLSRRVLLGSLAALGTGSLLRPRPTAAQDALLTRRIPSTGEALPLVGLGSWITFNVGEDPVLRDECAEVMRAFFAAGGRLIDSSPMYGSSEAVIGYGLEKLGRREDVFSATKVWTPAGEDGPAQVEESRGLWGVGAFDLLQVHNLVDWEKHLELLFAMKAERRLRYVGVTTSHGRRHDALETIMAGRSLDFVQVTYNVIDREVEARILPLAAERGIAIIVNRPFRGGSLTDDLEGETPPAWAGEIDCTGWPQLLLKFIVSHPAVTCAIPATTRVDHVEENLGASHGHLPDEALRQRLLAYLSEL